MRIAHWAYGKAKLGNGGGTGLNYAAEELVEAENRIGLESYILDPQIKEEVEKGGEADVHVVHSSLPDPYHAHPRKMFFAHGTPEHCSIYELRGTPDQPMAATLYWMREAEVIVTQWPRHKRIWDLYLPDDKECRVVRSGVNLERWKPEGEAEVLKGIPPIIFCESWFEIKRPLELFWAFAALARTPETAEGRLHIYNIPQGQESFWANQLEHMNLRHWVQNFRPRHENPERLFRGGGIVICPAWYGDHSRTCLEALACGSVVLARHGNAYATYTCDWQWDSIAKKIAEIVAGAPPDQQLKREEIDVVNYAQDMAKIYADFPEKKSRKYILPPLSKLAQIWEEKGLYGTSLISVSAQSSETDALSENGVKSPPAPSSESAPASETMFLSSEGFTSETMSLSGQVSASPTSTIPVLAGPNGGRREHG